jgi:DNA-binding GntR family transcriptional regulator
VTVLEDRTIVPRSRRQPSDIKDEMAGLSQPALSSGSALKSMAPQTKEHQVAELLRERIIAGSFVRGQRLKQAEIAQQLNLSITPVREALRLLEAEGYVRVSSHRGAVVAPFQVDQADELYDLRLMLEGKLTAGAAKRMTDDGFRSLMLLQTEIRDATQRGDRQGIRGGNFRFHFRLYELADMPHTLEFVRVLWAKYPFDLLGAIPGRPELVLDEHTVLLDALKQRDARLALRAMHAHITSGHRQFAATYTLEPGR